MPHKSVRLGLLSLAASLVLAGQAFAHAHLSAASPADKEKRATSPSDISLTFTEALDVKFSGIDLSSGAEKIKTGDASLGPDGKVLKVAVPQPLKPGTYTVNWHVLSVDGHKTNGTLTFTIAP
ncbi:copper homeostasis periplasmic binding protein CopC [Rhizobium paknamense]|uniref:Methionine-rich copper-binding protein CopC n=1 Tax=Rhizobium paknamense TaxID=1206817 RepID=A0ABU0IH21_9HYPH|nr:copper homeostasis periplasmic binding protein CopC [Rhizobium paknamense]MDQ0456695.1 methionine-rich copper-binding protein CopC [Rhizobium paknamense]